MNQHRINKVTHSSDNYVNCEVTRISDSRELIFENIDVLLNSGEEKVLQRVVGSLNGKIISTQSETQLALLISVALEEKVTSFIEDKAARRRTADKFDLMYESCNGVPVTEIMFEYNTILTARAELEEVEQAITEWVNEPMVDDLVTHLKYTFY